VIKVRRITGDRFNKPLLLVHTTLNRATNVGIVTSSSVAAVEMVPDGGSSIDESDYIPL
jgi:hypothetical protein